MGRDVTEIERAGKKCQVNCLLSVKVEIEKVS